MLIEELIGWRLLKHNGIGVKCILRYQGIFEAWPDKHSDISSTAPTAHFFLEKSGALNARQP